MILLAWVTTCASLFWEVSIPWDDVKYQLTCIVCELVGLVGTIWGIYEGNIVHCSNIVKSTAVGRRACFRRRVGFFQRRNPGLQPYLTRPRLKSTGLFSHSSRHTLGLTLQSLVCPSGSVPSPGQDRARGWRASRPPPPIRFLHCKPQVIHTPLLSQAKLNAYFISICQEPITLFFLLKSHWSRHQISIPEMPLFPPHAAFFPLQWNDLHSFSFFRLCSANNENKHSLYSVVLAWCHINPKGRDITTKTTDTCLRFVREFGNRFKIFQCFRLLWQIWR